MVGPLCSDAAVEPHHGHSLFKIPHAPFKDVPALQVLLWCACWARVRMYAHFVAVKLQSSVRTVAYERSRMHHSRLSLPQAFLQGACRTTQDAMLSLWWCSCKSTLSIVELSETAICWQTEGCSCGKLSALLEAECHMARLTGADPLQVG